MEQPTEAELRAAIENHLTALAALRQQETSAKVQATTALKTLEGTAEHQSYTAAIALCRELQNKVASEYTGLCAAALRLHLATTHTDLARGLQIKFVTSTDYDRSQAERWCREYAPCLLALNVKAWEDAAPHLPGAPIAQVRLPKVFVASDLTAYLPQGPTDAAAGETEPRP